MQLVDSDVILGFPATNTCAEQLVQHECFTRRLTSRVCVLKNPTCSSDFGSRVSFSFKALQETPASLLGGFFCRVVVSTYPK